jgi:hypothetical protein
VSRRRFSPSVVLFCYPDWWRARYAHEVDALVEDLVAGGRARWRVALSLALGALRVRLFATGAPDSAAVWRARTSAWIALGTLPWLAVIPLYGYFGNRSGDYETFVGGRVGGLSGAGRLATDAWGLMAWVLLGGVILLGSSWLRLLLAVLRDRTAGRFRRMVFVAWPGLTLLAGLAALLLGDATSRPGLATTVHRVGSHLFAATDPVAPARVWLSVGVIIILVGWFTTPWAVLRGLRRSSLSLSVLQMGSRTSLALSISSTVMLAAAALWQLAARLQPVPLKGWSYLEAGLGPHPNLYLAGLAGVAALSWAGTRVARGSYRRAFLLARV